MINKNKIILTDCDGVCLDWEYGFHTWMSTHGHELKNNNLYSVAKQYEMTDENAKRQVEIFNSSASMGFLPPLRDSQYYIKLLAEKLGYRFIAVTSLSNDESAQKLRTCNLKKLFGNDTFVEYHYLGCGDDKDEILLQLAYKFEGSIWVEDKYINAEVGADAGFDSLLMEHGHNLNYDADDRVRIVRNWEEIYNYVERKETERDLARRARKLN